MHSFSQCQTPLPPGSRNPKARVCIPEWGLVGTFSEGFSGVPLFLQPRGPQHKRAHFGPGHVTRLALALAGGSGAPGRGCGSFLQPACFWKQKGWHGDPSPVTSWRPGPDKELGQSPSALAWDMPLSPPPPAGDSLGKYRRVGGEGHCLRPLQCASWAPPIGFHCLSHPWETPVCDSHGLVDNQHHS